MLDSFFISGATPANLEKGVYAPLLVLVSYIVASFGSYVGLTLIAAMSGAIEKRTKNSLQVGGALAFGSGIWSMHFIGMLSYKMQMTVSYNPLITVASMLIAVVVAYGVFYVARSEKLSLKKLFAGSILLGITICGMHYTGMAAMKMDAVLRYTPGFFLLSFVIAIGASGAALAIILLLGRKTRSKVRYVWRTLAALVMGAAICGMHYTGMAAAVFIPFANCRHDPTQNTDTLAVVVGIVTCIIFGIALIFSLASHNKTDTAGEKNTFPVKLLISTSALTLAAVLWTALNSFYFNHQMTQGIGKDIQISQLSNQTTYFDSVMERAIKRYAITGDQKWGAIYKNNQKNMNDVIKKLEDESSVESSRNTGDLYRYNLVQKIDPSTDFFLEALEAKAMDLAEAGKLEEARAMLDGQEYTSRKQDYSDNVHQLADNTNETLTKTLSSLAETSIYTLYLGFVVITILPIAWYFSFQSIRRWRRELENARKTLIDNEKQLQAFISEIETSQKAAIKAREAAEIASAAKSEFLANMSHELRTPLNSVLGMLRLLEEGNLPEDERGLADTALHSSAHLLEIVNDILDLSKIEAREMQLERIGMDLSYAISSVVMTLDIVAKDKNLSIIRHKPHETLPYVLGDPTRFVRVLTNLIGNAIKYTDEGHIDIHPSFKWLDEHHIEFRCEIMDTGIGIPKEKQKSIFEKFTQADTSTTRKYGGTGLGLAITKQLVELMGGVIGVESEVYRGSTFWFTIPFEITDKLTIEKQSRRKKMHAGTIPPGEVRVLVAEDHPMNQILMRKLLNRFGIISFVIADNGVEVLKRYNETPWDLILMDCHMPDKNGYDTTREIRELEKGTDRHVPIVAMTADAMLGAKEECLRCGMDEYISKPINVDEFKEVLGQWISFPDFATTENDMVSSDGNAPLDLSLLKTFSEGDREIEKKLIGAFVEQSDKNIILLHNNCANLGAKIWHETAHMLKGSSSTIGAKLLAELCSEAQHFNGTAHEQEELFEKISREYIRVKEHLEQIGLLPS